ncbi:copper resistance protein CopC [Streptomyces sp. NPDC048606]|uniref:copper resistance CopC/CopD family protein n=1 Tax=Streptomyces sp. NPDC048606 TaxID=3154726 RepID=UPI003441D6A2
MPSGSPPARRSSTVLTPIAALLALFAALALLVGGAGPASAHAVLSGSDPADGAVLTTAPRQVTLTFTESVGLFDDSLRVLSPRNERVNPRPARHADGKDDTARVELSDDLPRGTYTVAWRVVSADGHPISGAFVFSLGEPSGTAAPVATGAPDDTAAGLLHGAARHVAYSGLALLVGVGAFVLVCLPAAVAARPLRRLFAAGWVALAASTVALLLLRGPYETAAPLLSAFDPAQLGRTVTSRPGLALIVRLLLLALTALSVRRWAPGLHGLDAASAREAGARVRSARVRSVAALLAVGLAGTWAAAEHASAGVQPALAMPVAVLHLLAMGVWLGGLATLLPFLRRGERAGGDVPASAVARFSTLAFGSVLVLVGTGVYQSWRQVGSWTALTTTPYGRTLLVKVAVVALVLGVARYSRRRTVLLVHAAPPGARMSKTPEPARVAQPVGVGPSPSGTDPDSPPAGPPGEEPGDGTEGADRTGPDAHRPDAHRPDAHRRALRRTVTAELALGAAVLMVTTLLTGTQPGRAAHEEALAAGAAAEPQLKEVTVPFDMGTANRRGTVRLTFSPGRVGENAVEAVVHTADGGLATVPELRLALTLEDVEIGPLDAGLQNRKGYWGTSDLRLPMPGVWTLDLTVRTTDIDQVTVRESVRIAAATR